MKTTLCFFALALAVLTAQPQQAPQPQTVTIQVSMSAADYQSIAEILPKIVRTTIQPIPGHPEQQQATSEQIYPSVEAFIGQAIQRAVAAEAKHYSNSRVLAAVSAAEQKAQELKDAQAQANAAATPTSITVTKAK